MSLKSSLGRYVASGVTEEEQAQRVRDVEGDLHRIGIGLVRYDDPTVPWELRHRVETLQAEKFGKRR